MLSVVIRSDEHGAQELEFETLGEALGAVKRLWIRSLAQSTVDGIERFVGLRAPGLKVPGKEADGAMS